MIDERDAMTVFRKWLCVRRTVVNSSGSRLSRIWRMILDHISGCKETTPRRLNTLLGAVEAGCVCSPCRRLWEVRQYQRSKGNLGQVLFFESTS